MHGLVSLLPTPYYEQIELLWQELESQYDLRGIHVTPLPHFSWQIASDYDIEELESIIKGIAKVTPPINVHTTGLALFTGLHPVVYVPVVKDADLFHLHTLIWKDVQPAAEGLSPYYSQLDWMPHISLAYQDVSMENIGDVMQNLSFRSYDWEMIVDNISLIYEPDGEIGALKFRVPLGG